MHKCAVGTCLQVMPEVQQIDAAPNREPSAVQLSWHNRGLDTTCSFLLDDSQAEHNHCCVCLKMAFCVVHALK